MSIGWEIVKAGEEKINPRHAENKTFLGDAKNPIAIGKKKDLWANLDAEFYSILDEAFWINTGAMNMDLGAMSYKRASGIRYILTDLKKRAV